MRLDCQQVAYMATAYLRMVLLVTGEKVAFASCKRKDKTFHVPLRQIDTFSISCSSEPFQSLQAMTMGGYRVAVVV